MRSVKLLKWDMSRYRYRLACVSCSISRYTALYRINQDVQSVIAVDWLAKSCTDVLSEDTF